MKEFSEVMIGDRGEDYGGEPATVIAKGTYEDLKRHDTSGACAELVEEAPELLKEMVAVVDEEGTHVLWVYGDGGFTVEEEK